MINRHISFSASNSPGRAYNSSNSAMPLHGAGRWLAHSEKSSTNRLGKSPDRC